MNTPRSSVSSTDTVPHQWDTSVQIPEANSTHKVTKIALIALAIFAVTLVAAVGIAIALNPVTAVTVGVCVTVAFTALALGAAIGYGYANLKYELERGDDFGPANSYTSSSSGNFSIGPAQAPLPADPHIATQTEVDGVTKGLTNPGCNCFMNALLQNLFQNESYNRFVMEKLEQISQNEAMGVVNSLIPSADEQIKAVVQCPRRMKSEDYNKLVARLKAKQADIIAANPYPMPAALGSEDILEVLKLVDTQSVDIYKAISLKQAAGYAHNILSKWQRKEEITAQEGKLLRLSLIKLMNSKVTCELYEETDSVLTAPSRHFFKKPTVSDAKVHESLAAKRQRTKLAISMAYDLRKKGISKVRAEKLILKALNPKKKPTPIKVKSTTTLAPAPEAKAKIRWIIPGIDGAMNIHHGIQECPGEMFSKLINSLSELTKSKAPSKIQADRSDEFFDHPTDGATQFFDESLRIKDSTLTVDEGTPLIQLSAKEVVRPKMNLANLADFENCKSISKELDEDYQDKFGRIVSTKKTYSFKLPETLNVHVKLTAFDETSGQISKILAPCYEFSDEENFKITFNAGVIAEGTSNPDTKTYELNSFIVHEGGTADSGHYFTFTKYHREDGTSFWVLQDDGTCRPVSKYEVKQLLKGQGSQIKGQGSQNQTPCMFSFKESA